MYEIMQISFFSFIYIFYINFIFITQKEHIYKITKFFFIIKCNVTVRVSERDIITRE